MLFRSKRLSGLIRRKAGNLLFKRADQNKNSINVPVADGPERHQRGHMPPRAKHGGSSERAIFFRNRYREMPQGSGESLNDERCIVVKNIGWFHWNDPHWREGAE